jgi:glutaredoxin-like protein NrdH
MSDQVTIYTKRGSDGSPCQACRLTKNLLDRENLAYVEIDVTDNEKHQAELIAAGHRQMPVVMTPTDVWAGFRPERVRGLKGLMNAAGV